MSVSSPRQSSATRYSRQAEAGKTTAIRTSSKTSGLISKPAIVYDSNFNSLASARAEVTLALEAGLRAIVIFVHRHPVEAYLQGVLPRALVEGRTVSIEGHLRMHRSALKTSFVAREPWPSAVASPSVRPLRKS